MTVETEIQMRFADIDMLGHVNNVNLQHYFDMGKSDYFSKALNQPIEKSEQGLIQKATNIVYQAQTRLSEQIVVLTHIEKIGIKSITFYQEIKNKNTGELKAYCTATLVAFDFKRQQSIEIPLEWRSQIEELLQK